jgi:hypothetical protein
MVIPIPPQVIPHTTETILVLVAFSAFTTAQVQRIFGHSSPVTTAAYDRRPEETRRKALREIHVPYLHIGKSI